MKDSAASNVHPFNQAYLYYELMLSLARRAFAMFSPLQNLISGVPFFVCSFPLQTLSRRNATTDPYPGNITNKAILY
jgi:hypothetical protein